MSDNKPCAKCRRKPEGQHCQPCGSPAWESYQPIDKCREAWEKWKAGKSTDMELDLLDKHRGNYYEALSILSFHAGYHARKVPTEKEILDALLLVITEGADEEDMFKITKIQANRIHLLMVEGME